MREEKRRRKETAKEAGGGGLKRQEPSGRPAGERERRRAETRPFPTHTLRSHRGRRCRFQAHPPPSFFPFRFYEVEGSGGHSGGGSGRSQPPPPPPPSPQREPHLCV